MIYIWHFIKVTWMVQWRLFVLGSLIMEAQGAGGNEVGGIIAMSSFVVAPAAAIAIVASGWTIKFFPVIYRLRGRGMNPFVRIKPLPPSAYKYERLVDGQTVRVPQPVKGKLTRKQRKELQAYEELRATVEAAYNAPEAVAAREAAQEAYENQFVDKPTRSGLTTGFEPYALESVEISYAPYKRGEPGRGLDASAFSTTHVQLGQEGEVNFAKALQKAGLLERFGTVWSSSLPSLEHASIADEHYTGDIDVIVFTGSKIFLYDLKNYASGDVTYYTDAAQQRVYAVDNPTGKYLRGHYKMSKNMETALERYEKHNFFMNVRAEVVLMPTNYGEPTVDHNARWTGGVPVTTLSAVIRHLSTQSDFGPESKTYRAYAAAASLVR